MCELSVRELKTQLYSTLEELWDLAEVDENDPIRNYLKK
jgi:hypothetical protein